MQSHHYFNLKEEKKLKYKKTGWSNGKKLKQVAWLLYEKIYESSMDFLQIQLLTQLNGKTIKKLICISNKNDDGNNTYKKKEKNNNYLHCGLCGNYCL